MLKRCKLSTINSQLLTLNKEAGSAEVRRATLNVQRPTSNAHSINRNEQQGFSEKLIRLR